MEMQLILAAKKCSIICFITRVIQTRMTLTHSSVFFPSIVYFVRCQVTDGAVMLLFSKWLACHLRRTAANRARMGFIVRVETFTVTKGKIYMNVLYLKKKPHVKLCITITYVINHFN